MQGKSPLFADFIDGLRRAQRLLGQTIHRVGAVIQGKISDFLDDKVSRYLFEFHEENTPLLIGKLVSFVRFVGTRGLTPVFAIFSQSVA